MMLEAIFDGAERWQVAAHEAGHAVAAARLGVAFRRVSIVRDGDEFGRVVASRARFYPKQRRKQDVVTMAGPVAEEALGVDDHSRPLRSEWAMDFNEFRADAVRGEAAVVLAAALIEPDLDLVTRVADVLIREGTVTGTEVREIAPRLPLHTWPDLPMASEASMRLSHVVVEFFRRAIDELDPGY